MKCAVILLALVCLAFAAESDVLDLTSATYKDAIKDNQFILVEYFAPWCGHCKSLAPEYEKAATALKEKGSEIKLAKVDCTKEESIARDEGIQGFPTLKFFRNGNAIPFEGERSADSIVNWVELKSGPVVKTLDSEDAIKEHLKAKSANVVGHFADSTTGEYVDFLAAAQNALFEDFAPFGVIESADLAAKFGLENNQVKIAKGEEEAVYKGDFNDFADFVSKNVFPLVEEISQKSYTRASNSGKPIVLVFHGESDKDAVLAMTTEIATEFSSKAVFLYGAGATFARNLAAMGASGEKFPTALTLNIPNRPKPVAFEEASEFTKETFVAFVNGVLDGSYVGNKKSEAVPEDNNGPVKVVVGNNFDAIVMDETKDVLLEFYAPWCGHCKSLAPIYEDLGKKLADNANIVIAKIDATANWYPDSVEVQGYPTIFLFRAKDKKTPVSFDGDRTVEGFESWLKEKADTAFGAHGKEEL
mmetsp:Transcript_18428/g.46878  ORF Transcript_18428/g.46878 Transcript_18428/m.46878 type:complete len:474 (-) Transcript_18428:156-1577(-)|eukprot:CAMPEP_0177651104 /NCGR_PEP_ID=MMETSP0447-20121125/12339_1 /TAXON_ID=0 /ORGANISM="Stygamoeba regulata, Strain BSH-02190019" /LENGTH=473 /DNA_ID=CAMNT_0019154101 /DNA_START=36 /DNA_END=1457 /DNA_ORIENTATION=-